LIRIEMKCYFLFDCADSADLDKDFGNAKSFIVSSKTKDGVNL